VPPRADLVERLNLMEKAFRKVRFEMDRSVHLMNDFLSADLLMYLGRSLTYRTINDALEEDACPKDLITRIGHEIGNRHLTIGDLEDYYANHRHGLGLKKGHLLLKHLIESVHDSLRKFVEADRLNDGGRPPNVARRVLIHIPAHARTSSEPRSAVRAHLRTCILALLSERCGNGANHPETA